MSKSPKTGFGTLAVHAGQAPDAAFGSRAAPIHQTTSYVFRDADHAANLFALKEIGHIYTRLNNPTNDVVEARMAALEGGVGALAHASGQAAITNALLNIMNPGDRVLSVSQLYGGTHTLFHHTLPKLGMHVDFVDGTDPENFRKALKPKTKAIFGETMGNPSLDMFPIREVAAIANEAGVPLILDNTALSPALCRPLEWGAHIVLHSMTKFCGGHGVAIGGMVIDGGTFNWGNGNFPGFTEADPSYHGLVYWDAFRAFEPMGGANVAYILKMRLQYMRDTGNCQSPFNSWLHLLGLETLHLRMERHCANALKVAGYLQQHEKVSWVNYPGLPGHRSHKATAEYCGGKFGALLGFGLKGGLDAGRQFISSLDLFSHLANIGDAKSLAIHPASTTHSQLDPAQQQASGVTPDYVRLSVGIEDIDDIIADLEQALAKVPG